VGAVRPVLWHGDPPPISEPGDRFTVRVLELDERGAAKDPSQFASVHEAAQRAEDIFVFVHGWRRDAHDVEAMRAFLHIYRGAFDCLSTRDEEGTRSCTTLHAYCHPRNADSKLVILVLWDAYSGPFGFRSVQVRADVIGREGFHALLTQLHGELNGRGTMLVLGHSLGGAMVASALQRCAETGQMPVDGAIILVGAFDATRFNALKPPSHAEGGGLYILNLYNPHDGYLRMYRWVLGHKAAGEGGLDGIATVRGDAWAKEGSACDSAQVTTFGASIWETASPRQSPAGSQMLMLNLNMDGLVDGHVDIEHLGAIRLYNRAATELIFQTLWSRAPENASAMGHSGLNN
jgi:pimeloyl-ACP methyl ester carboxylesterase